MQQSFWLNQGCCVDGASALESPCSTFMAKQRRQKKAQTTASQLANQEREAQDAVEQTRTRARCARRGQRRTQHIATKDTEEKYEEKTEKIVLRKRGLG